MHTPLYWTNTPNPSVRTPPWIFTVGYVLIPVAVARLLTMFEPPLPRDYPDIKARVMLHAHPPSLDPHP